MVVVRLIGVVVVLVGAALAVEPSLVGIAPQPDDLFAAVERRIYGGMLGGLGLLLALRPALKPWGELVAWAVACVVTGALVARLGGILVDGSTAKQWLWVVVEVVVVAAPVAWLARRARGGAPA